MAPRKRLSRAGPTGVVTAAELMEIMTNGALAERSAAQEALHDYEVGPTARIYAKDFAALEASQGPTDVLRREKKIRNGHETAYLRKRTATAYFGTSAFWLEKLEESTNTGLKMQRFNEAGRLIERQKRSKNGVEAERWVADPAGELQRVYFSTLKRGVRITEELRVPDPYGNRLLVRKRNDQVQLFNMDREGRLTELDPQGTSAALSAGRPGIAPRPLVKPEKETIRRGLLRKTVLQTFPDGRNEIKTYRLGSKREVTQPAPNQPLPVPMPPNARASVQAITPEAAAASLVADAADAAEQARRAFQIAEDHALAVKMERGQGAPVLALPATPAGATPKDAADLASAMAEAFIGKLDAHPGKSTIIYNRDLKEMLKAVVTPILEQSLGDGIARRDSIGSRTSWGSSSTLQPPLQPPIDDIGSRTSGGLQKGSGQSGTSIVAQSPVMPPPPPHLTEPITASEAMEPAHRIASVPAFRQPPVIQPSTEASTSSEPLTQAPSTTPIAWPPLPPKSVVTSGSNSTGIADPAATVPVIESAPPPPPPRPNAISTSTEDTANSRTTAASSGLSATDSTQSGVPSHEPPGMVLRPPGPPKSRFAGAVSFSAPFFKSDNGSANTASRDATAQSTAENASDQTVPVAPPPRSRFSPTRRQDHAIGL